MSAFGVVAKITRRILTIGALIAATLSVAAAQAQLQREPIESGEDTITARVTVGFEIAQ
jgi:uncharacterized protein YggE